jgi:acyl dehydratase
MIGFPEIPVERIPVRVSIFERGCCCQRKGDPMAGLYFEEFAKQTEFGQRLVNSLFTLGLVIGLSVGETTLGTTVANLGMTDVRFPKPVFHGDTLRARTIVRSKRRSQSRKDAGIVEFEHQGINQRGEIVAVCRRAALMNCRTAED